jgi:methylphosphotriester-DNA--protein-cysteine methyltransferase
LVDNHATERRQLFAIDAVVAVPETRAFERLGTMKERFGHVDDDGKLWRTFIRRFGDATGVPPGEWVLQARLAEARDLLETTDVSVEEVATATGFGSADALRHHFRARVRTSPIRYRSSFRGRER